MTLLSGRTVPQVLKMMDQPTWVREVSIVGHKFPKIRFEKNIRFHWELVISLRGPLPTLESTSMDRKDSVESNENNNAESAVSLRDKSIISEGDKDTEKMSTKKRACILNLILRNPKKSLQLIKIGVYTS